MLKLFWMHTFTYFSYGLYSDTYGYSNVSHLYSLPTSVISLLWHAFCSAKRFHGRRKRTKNNDSIQFFHKLLL